MASLIVQSLGHCSLLSISTSFFSEETSALSVPGLQIWCITINPAIINVKLFICIGLNGLGSNYADKKNWSGVRKDLTPCPKIKGRLAHLSQSLSW